MRLQVAKTLLQSAKYESPRLEKRDLKAEFYFSIVPIVYVVLCKPARPRPSHDTKAVGDDTGRRP